jgi:repressor LexA
VPSRIHALDGGAAPEAGARHRRGRMKNRGRVRGSAASARGARAADFRYDARMPPANARAVPLSDRQREILDAFRLLTAKRGSPPSTRDVANFVKIQVSAAYRHLRELRRLGRLEMRHGSFRLPGASSLPVPVVARPPVKDAVESAEPPAGWLPCPPEWGEGRDLFAIVAPDSAMAADGILQGDRVVCARSDRAKDGELVVAVVRGQTFVRRLGRVRGAAALLASDGIAKPVFVSADVRIAGLVVGVVRALAS